MSQPTDPTLAAFPAGWQPALAHSRFLRQLLAARPAVAEWLLANAAAQGVAKATELASESGSALNEIVHFAAHTTELIAGIATAAEEQSATSEEITRAVDEINAIAGETSHGMLESSAAVQELANMAQNLKTLLDKLQA